MKIRREEQRPFTKIERDLVTDFCRDRDGWRIPLDPIVIIGAGPAGLSAAFELTERAVGPLVLEKSNAVGGIARTENHNGYLFDVGGHRFFTKNKEIEKLWREMAADNLLTVARLSRIFYQDRFFNYPLGFSNALSNLGLAESVLILFSYLKSRGSPYREEKTFEQWVSNRFGKRLYETFFKTYTEKVWGIPCSEIGAEWAAQRIRGLSLLVAVSNALLNLHTAKSLISEFLYPLNGPGMMWEGFQKAVESGGGRILFNAEVTGILHDGRRIAYVEYAGTSGGNRASVLHLISSMPITKLVTALDPKPPGEVLEAAGNLRHRSFIMVGLVVDKEDLFPDQWIYIHSPEVQVGRIQNFKNWSSAMVPDPGRTSVGMEYFCNEGDELWKLPDEDLVEIASTELSRLGFCEKEHVTDGFVLRQPMAYPVYDQGYQERLTTIRACLERFDNLHTIGRNGMHRYNNMDHSMLSGVLAARNALGARKNLWDINEEEKYLEEDQGERRPFMESFLSRTFARMDKLAFATALGLVCGLTVALATLWLVIKGGDVVGPNMSLLNQYFFGYSVTLKGACLGFGYSFSWGFLFGWLFAYLRNLFLALSIFQIRKRAEKLSFQDFLDGF